MIVPRLTIAPQQPSLWISQILPIRLSSLGTRWGERLPKPPIFSPFVSHLSLLVEHLEPMKKRNRRRNSSKQRRTQRKAHILRIEDLEERRLLTGDACVVLGPGNVSDVDRIDAFSFITEEETSEVAVVDRVTNNTFATAQAIPLGFDAGETVAIDITGELIEPISVGALVNQETSPDPANIPPIDDSSIPAANRINHQTGNPILSLIHI